VTPPYARIAADLRDRIAAGVLRPGDLVPSARQITREFGVALATATKVLAALRDDGLVRPVPGIGTVVAAPAAGPPVPVVHKRRAAEGELTGERVVRAAVAVADRDGLGGLSMRRIATELGTATMSLYRHVPNKDELVLRMADAVFGDNPPPAERPAGWRAQLEALARVQWAGYRRHPWLASVISLTRPQLFPNGIAHTEWALLALDELNLDPGTRLHAVVTLVGYVRGTATNFEPQARDEQDTGVTDHEWQDAHEPEYAAYFSDGRYPMLAKISRTPVDLDLDSLFEFGLASLLDGYAARFNG
jgi:AcrR family transcriptional regulator